MRSRAVRLFTGIVTIAVSALTAAAARADTIASGETKLDTLVNNSSKSWDFSGTAGDRVIVTTSEQTNGIQPDIYLYYNDPNLGLVLEDSSTGPFTEERLERALSSTGTYTITIREYQANQSGYFSAALVQIPGGATSTADTDGGAIGSGATLSGTFDYQADTDIFTFDGTKDDHVIVTVSDTSFSCQPEILLYPPSGGVAEGTRTGSASQKKLELRLAETGKYTIVLGDYQLNQEGTYAVSLVKIPGDATSTGDTDGGALDSGGTATGVLTPKADLDVFTFDGTAGDRVIVTTSDFTSGTQTEIYLYPPAGGDLEASSVGAFFTHRLERQLSSTGTYTIVLHDSGLNGEGSYAISLAKIPGATTSASDEDGGTLEPGATKTGVLTPRSDMDIFTFDGSAGERVIITTADFTVNSQAEIYLYPPAGADLEASSVGLFTTHRLERLLSASGKYTIVVSDSGLNGEGDYAISLAKIPGSATTPTDDEGGPLSSGSSKVGRLLNRADADVWQFWGEEGARVLVTTANLAGGVQPEIYLYPDDGGELVASDKGGLTVHKLDTKLPKAGLYNIVVTDYLNRHDDGYYLITLVTLPGPATSTDDTDGGPIDFDREVTAAFQGAGDFDAWQFYGAAGDQVTITAARTSTGSSQVEPDIYLYPPDQGAVEASETGGGSTHRLVWQLKQTGLYTVVLNDDQRANSGSYTVTVSKSPPTRAPGVYNQFPPLGATLSDLTESLKWAPVTGATTYDVRLGTDLLAALPVVATDLAAPAFPLPGDVAAEKLYYWQVTAHTPAGDVRSPITWFRTAAAPVNASDDFSDGDPTGDKNWIVVSGTWKVDALKRYQSIPLADVTILDCRTLFAATGNFVVGEFSTRVSPTNLVVPGYTRPNAELAFAVDPTNVRRYRFVRLTAGRIELGQFGSFAGDDDKSRVKKKAPVRVNGSLDVKVVVLSDGLVNVFVKTTKATKYPVKPIISYKFKGVSPGYLGFRTLGARARFDNFTATSRAFVP